MSDGEVRTADGRLFHACGAATGNERSPKVDRLTGGMSRVLVADERHAVEARSHDGGQVRPHGDVEVYVNAEVMD